MATERLHMDPAAQRYHGYEAAAHVARYALARRFCTGRRVLDIACGEGYGSALLAGWGAREVVGIDIAAEAGAAANARFAGPSVRFLHVDALAAEAMLADQAPFDLIVSLETVEHVADPAAFLAVLRRLAAPEAVILISCPNDPAMLAPGEDNPFHLRRFTFAEFRDLAEAALGPARGWLLETPAIGFVHYPQGDAATETAATGPADIVRARDAGPALALPAQAGAAPSAADCHAYVGLWGDTTAGNCVLTPLSHSAYMWGWRELARLEAENQAMRAAQQADRRQLLRYGEEIVAHPAAQRAAAAREEAANAAREEALAEAARLADALRDARAGIAARDQALAEAAERSAAEAAALNAALEATRARAAALETALREAGEHAASLLAETGGLRQTLARTQETLARTSETLSQTEQKLLGIERSRFYRLSRAYVALYTLPLIGPVLGAARRGVGRLVRAVRGR
jgi:SAM-dependent methyltransferase